MGLEEAQKAETFRAGELERFGEMGEVVGSRKLVAMAEWLPIPFVVENDHDLISLLTRGGEDLGRMEIAMFVHLLYQSQTQGLERRSTCASQSSALC